MRIRNPFGGPAVDITVLIAVGAGVYLLYKHYASANAAAAANAAALAAANAAPGVANVNPGNAFWTQGASLYTPAAYG